MRIAACLTLALVALALPGLLGPARAEVPTDPPTFTNPLDIDNPYHPFVNFRIRLYESQQGHADLTVIDVFRPDTRTFELDGVDVTCACLEEYEIEDGEIVEISLNYFAQADDGTVYYFGEVVDIYDGGVVVGHGGSWLVGGPGAGDPTDTLTADEPTIFMPADPEVGDTWKPEDLPDDGLEEFVTVVRFRKKLNAPLDKFDDVMEVREKTPDIAYKNYAYGVGFIQDKEKGEIVSIVDILDAADEEGMEDNLADVLDEVGG